jgi:F-type H+-transporting ATPase subunit a
MTTFNFNFNPLEQFEIRDFITLDAPILNNFHLSLTNISTYLMTSLLIIIFVHLLTGKYSSLIYKNWLLSKECIYDTVYSITINQINNKEGQIYFPFIYTLFLFILINNLIGMIPYSFSSTSHFILTFSLSFTIVIGDTILGFNKHSLKFFSLFVPAGCPLALLPLLVIIEFISYLARNISLGLRLAANVLSGHMLLSILSGFTYKIMTSGFLYLILGLLPLMFIIAFSSLELAIAFIQAQVFIVLSCGYTKDALELH